MVAKPTTDTAWLEEPPYKVEVNFGLSRRRQEELRPELEHVLHASFIDHPDYDRDNLPEFLASDLYLRVFMGRELAGIFTTDMLQVAGRPVCHLISGLVLPGMRSGGSLMSLCNGLTLDLASQAFGGDEFYVAMRSANPRVMAKLWKNPWVRFYPQPNWDEWDPLEREIRPGFGRQAFGGDRSSLVGRIFHDIYPTPPWGGKIPWHHDPKVNDFCRAHLSNHHRDAFLFLGPTTPPFEGMPRGRVKWPG
jgi:hypothetical protein